VAKGDLLKAFKTILPEPDLEFGKVDINDDLPEVGLTTLSYEPTVSEWNLDVQDGENTMTLPTVAFRKALKDYLGGDGP